ncbi:MAG: hypothetical protein IAC87_00860 [Muribaculum sp.]|uniref:Uncharacterized protein n=1 Tax=Candidatus Merdivivens faecigallinarum TaxID=2840871 RepID=A0A9D9IY29_9BACT|nr:hypothetical protein [Candidatus Merdivivens faecigallinarum]
MDDKIRDIEDKSLKINPYTVPEGYFGSLEGRIMERIGGCGAEGSGHGVPGVWERFFKPALGMALSFALVFAIGFGIMKLTGREDGADFMSLDEYDMMKAVVYNVSDEDSSATSDNALTEDEVVEYLMCEDRVMLYLAATYDEDE